MDHKCPSARFLILIILALSVNSGINLYHVSFHSNAQKWTESFDNEKKGLSLGQFDLMADFMKY